MKDSQKYLESINNVITLIIKNLQQKNSSKDKDEIFKNVNYLKNIYEQ
jgi:hypothetical protein